MKKSSKKHTSKKHKVFRRQNTSLTATQLANHDPGYDLDTLTRAEEIRASKPRMDGAMRHARMKHSVLSSILQKGSKDEKEMEHYAKTRKGEAEV